MPSNSQQFPIFYREHGVLRLDSLVDPEPTLIHRLPVDSAIHYLGVDDNPELDTSDPLMKGYSERVRYMDITTHSADHNHGSYRPKNLSQEQANFRKKNRNFELVREFKNLKSTTNKQLMVFNYGYLDTMYRYTEDRVANFKRFDDKLWTVANTIQTVEKYEPRNHFIVLPVPTQLVPKSVLDNRSMEPIQKLAVYFPGEDEQILRYIWMFINPRLKKDSVFGLFTDDQLRHVNLLFKMFDGKMVIVNLGYLYSWVIGNPNLTLNNSVTSKSHEDVQKYYLRSMMTIREIDLRGAALNEQLAAEEEQKRLLEKAQQIELASEEGEVSEEDERFLEEADEVEAAIRAKKHFTPHVDGDAGDTSERSEPVPNPTGDIDVVNLVTDDDAIDRDIAALEKIESIKADKLRKVSESLGTKEQSEYTSEITTSVIDIRKELLTYNTPESAVIGKLEQLAKEGAVTGAEFRKKSELIAQAVNQKDPYGSDLTVSEASVIEPSQMQIESKEITLNVPKTVIDKSMGKSSLSVMNRKYNSDFLRKDILSCTQALQKSGVIIKRHTVTPVATAIGDYDIHTLEIVPLNGQPSIIRQRIPRVDDDGTFTCKGVKYVMRHQIVDVPIRRVGEDRVSLSSYYGKVSVERTSSSSKTNIEYIINRLTKATIEQDGWLMDVTPGMVFDNQFVAPYVYSGISKHFMSFRAGDMQFDFNHKGFRLTLPEELLRRLETNGQRVCGKKGDGVYIVIDDDNVFHEVSSTSKEKIGSIYDILRLDESLAPVDHAQITIFNNKIPVAFFLARQIGFRKLVKFLNAKHRIVVGRKQKNLQPYEYFVQFRDVAYIFDRRESVNTMILAGFRDLEKEVKQYDAELFDLKDVYTRILENKGINLSVVTEMQNLQDMFIDPITERILNEMNEPTTFNGLVIRSCELLKTYYYPDSQDTNYQRIRGYDRFAGLFYKEMTDSIRAFKYKNRTGRGKVDASPFAVWKKITRDSSVKHAEDINPIQDVKITQEAVTYVGEGGRSKQTMVKDTRAYSKSNLGILSEASVDSSDVGVNAFMSADPGFKTLDGVADSKRELTPSSILSTSALLAPFSTYDDQKRINFIGIQQAHTIATEGYEPATVRTGYESVIGMRCGPMFAQVAKMDGVVKSVTATGVIVSYEDGSEKGYDLGTVFGKAEGSVYPHSLVTELKVGDKVKKDDYITYNTKFFSKDPILPGGVVYKGSLLARAVLVELPVTHEDSSAISKKLSLRLRTTTTKVKTFTVNFRENVHDVVKIGQKLRPEDTLLVIEDEITSSDGGLKESSLQILSERSKNQPKSEYIGTVSDVEVLYHGDMSDMTSTLKSLTLASNKRKANRAMSTARLTATGEVDSDYSVEGNPLLINKAVIKIYINVDDEPGTGDKIVVSNQLKSIIGEVMDYTLRSEDGQEIDVQFGSKSFAARIVNSLIMIGTRATALKALEKKAIELYRK